MSGLEEAMIEREMYSFKRPALEEPAPLLELWREGTFRVEGFDEAKDRCGLTDSREYRYEVRLFGDPSVLDSHGFLLDNRIVNQYWLDKYQTPSPKTIPSCENIAAQALKDFRGLCKMCGIGIEGAEIRVYGGTHSAVTVRWGTVLHSQATPAAGAPVPHPQREPIDDSSGTLQHLKQLLAGVH